MKTNFNKIFIIVSLLALFTQLTSCEALQSANNKQKGAVIGATGGAILGAILGNNVGDGDNEAIGAVIGTVVGGTAGAIIGNKMDKQAHEIEEEVPGAEVERVENGIVVTFDDESGVHFATDKYNLNDEAKSILDKLAAIFYENPDTNILIVGHTDSVGSEEYNLKLSERRAKAVTNYFTQEKGLPASRFVTKWYGETKPIYDNSTPEGRAKNRRVNIVILPSEKMIQDAEKEAGENND